MTGQADVPTSETNARSGSPYTAFNFRIRWHGRCVAGFSGMSALGLSIDTADWRAGHGVSTARKLPGPSKPGAVTFERGLTCDADFEAWARRACSGDKEAAGAKDADGMRDDLVIELYDPSAALASAVRVFRCRVCAFEAQPGLDGKVHVVAIESITLEHEGWSREPVVR